MDEIINSADIKSVMNTIGAQAKTASKTLAQADSEQKNNALRAMADALWECAPNHIERKRKRHAGG